ncbi:MAG: hypothetical protein CMQ24_20900 [Gammaproteobacteria bacterium]|nr:hypothetical protein [Gammaproteobacteria bacterium]
MGCGSGYARFHRARGSMLAGLRARCGSSSPRVRLRGRPGPGFCDGGALAEVLARHCARALWIFGALLAGTLPAAGADDAERWLERMGSALRTENYVGVVTYVRGPEIDSVRVVHRVAGGREYERLIHLNGQPREIYTEGARSVYLQPQGATIAPHGVSLGPFTRTFHDNLALNRNLYDVTVGSAGRVAGRSAQQLLIRPRQGDRYGYELWLDQSTGLLLQSVLVDGGQILEAFHFATVDVGGKLSAQALVSTLPEDSEVHVLSDGPVEGGAAIPSRGDSVAESPSFEPGWLPDGFMRVRLEARDNHLSYSDGLATFSLFVEVAPADEMPDLVTKVGGTVMVTQRLSGSREQVTLVGELPAATAKRVADSVRRVER